jgi:hypothetical protein
MSGWLDREIGLEILCQLLRVFEGVGFDSWLQEEIERIERRQFHDEVDINYELIRFVPKKDTCQMIVVDVELPIEEMFGGSDI